MNTKELITTLSTTGKKTTTRFPSISKWIKTVINPYHGIFSDKRKWTIKPQNDMDDSEIHVAKWKKLVWEVIHYQLLNNAGIKGTGPCTVKILRIIFDSPKLYYSHPSVSPGIDTKTPDDLKIQDFSRPLWKMTPNNAYVWHSASRNT